MSSLFTALIVIGTLIALVIVVLLINTITTIVHETGHLIPALLFTSGPVQIFIGSHGDIDNGVKIEVGRIQLFFKYRVIYWEGGLVSPTNVANSWFKQFLIVFGGPFLSVCFGGFVIYYTFEYVENGWLFIVGCLMGTSALFDFYINIFAQHPDILLYDGRHTQSDGRSLANIWLSKSKYGLLSDYNMCIHSQQYREAALLGEELLASFNLANKCSIVPSLITVYCQFESYQEATRLFEEFDEGLGLDADLYVCIANAYSHNDQLELALLYSARAIEIDPNLFAAWNNLAFYRIQVGNYQQAIDAAETAITLDPTNALGYINRAYGCVEIGEYKMAILDIRMSLSLDPGIAYTHRILGLYHLRQGQQKLALEAFLHVRSLEPDMDGLEELILEASQIA